jgi:tyrosinase
MSFSPSTRRSLAEVQKDYDSGNKAPLETLMRAWKGIKDLPPEDPNSFFSIGGLHGEPFRGKGEFDANWWGGYCQHGTVLFPSWHRAYLWRLEQALKSIPGCADVTLPFWDECSDESRESGIPKALTQATFELDGETIVNPLRSFVLPIGISDQVKDDPIRYSKPAGYETVRYPLSGLVGTPADEDATRTHNAQFPDYEKNVGYLNDNIATWLSGKIKVDGNWVGEVYSRFVKCLDAPNYTLFSNTTSAGAWNKAKGTRLVPLEAPHNYIHLAVGGFDYPTQGDFSAIPGANGDMGENDTAGLDPIFFFHHCFIDYVFWVWQRRHGFTNELTIEANDPGANSNANPPPVGIEPNTPLTLDTPLAPFNKADGTGPFSTADCVNIEGQLGYTYGPGSLDSYAQSTTKTAFAAMEVTEPGRTVHVSGVNRAQIRGSFLISVFASVDGKRQYVGTEAVLSRWHVEGCMNCLRHLEATASFRLPLNAADALPGADGVEVEVRTRDGLLGGNPRAAARTGTLAARLDLNNAPFKVDVY